MIVLNTDLDNTIIYSYKQEIGNDRKNVEIYQGREISYITNRTYEYLNIIKKKLLIVPITTRTIEQYERIDLGIGTFIYALVCNGGVLLQYGKRDEQWYLESLKLVEKSRCELAKAMRLLEKESRRKFELRYIEKLFIFTKCDYSELVVTSLKEELDMSLVDVFNNGEKVYVVPRELSKGNAIDRFRKYIQPDKIIAAGDSEFDVSMLKSADVGIAPLNFRNVYGADFDIIEVKGEDVFAHEMLEKVMDLLEK